MSNKDKAEDAPAEEVASSIFDAVASYDEKPEAKEEQPSDAKAAEVAQQAQSAQQQFLLQQQQM